MFTFVFVFSFLGLIFYAGYVFSRISRNMSINRIVSKSAEARALMAKDPLRFHASIVYLMASLLKTTPPLTKTLPQLLKVIPALLNTTPRLLYTTPPLL